MDTLEAYLDALASAAPTPGGGSAACLVAATGAALVAMVARITLGSTRLEAHHDAARELVATADARRAELIAARAADEAAYNSVVAAMAMRKESPAEKSERTAALQAALRDAAAAPLHAAALSVEVLELAKRALELGNANLASDIGCAAEFAAAALAAAAFNVRVNHRFMKEADAVRRQDETLRRLQAHAAQALARVRVEMSAQKL